MAIINKTWNIEHLQLKFQTKAQWDAESDSGANFVLAAGELGLELDTKKVKLGDGVKKWSELDYYSDPVIAGLVEALTTRMGTAESDITQLKTDVQTLQKKVEAIEGITTISVNPAADESTGA